MQLKNALLKLITIIITATPIIAKADPYIFPEKPTLKDLYAWDLERCIYWTSAPKSCNQLNLKLRIEVATSTYLKWKDYQKKNGTETFSDDEHYWIEHNLIPILRKNRGR